MTTAKALVQRQHTLLHQRDILTVPELYAPDGYYQMPGLRVRPNDLPELMRAYLTAFPDIDNQITAWIETDNEVALEQTIVGTHQGILITPFGTLPPTGKQVRWESADIVRTRNGLITSWHSYFDQLHTLTTLGSRLLL